MQALRLPVLVRSVEGAKRDGRAPSWTSIFMFIFVCYSLAYVLLYVMLVLFIDRSMSYVSPSHRWGTLKGVPRKAYF